jgi:hypothetical protein
MTYPLAVPQPARRRPDDFGDRAVLLDWDREFLPWLRGEYGQHRLGSELITLPPPWRPGVHWALNGPTGQGKSTFGVGIVSQRKWALSLDPKGEDETLEASGYVRLREIPPPRGRRVGRPEPGTDRWVWERIDQGLPVGLIVGFEAMTDAEDILMHKLMQDAITWCRRCRGWTLYVDEFELLSSQRMMRLGPHIERMLITARRAGTSVVTSFQSPAWVSKHATRQAGLITTWATNDEDMVKAIARAAGRDWRVLMQVIRELPPYHCITVSKWLRSPFIVTCAPKVS